MVRHATQRRNAPRRPQGRRKTVAPEEPTARRPWACDVIYRFFQWDREFEPDARLRARKDGSVCDPTPLPYLRQWINHDPHPGGLTRREIDQRRREIIRVGGARLYGIYRLLAEYAGDAAGWRGYLVDHRGRPAAPESIAGLYGLDPHEVGDAIRLLASPELARLVPVPWPLPQGYRGTEAALDAGTAPVTASPQAPRHADAPTPAPPPVTQSAGDRQEMPGPAAPVHEPAQSAVQRGKQRADARDAEQTAAPAGPTPPPVHVGGGTPEEKRAWADGASPRTPSDGEAPRAPAPMTVGTITGTPAAELPGTAGLAPAPTANGANASPARGHAEGVGKSDENSNSKSAHRGAVGHENDARQAGADNGARAQVNDNACGNNNGNSNGPTPSAVGGGNGHASATGTTTQPDGGVPPNPVRPGPQPGAAARQEGTAPPSPCPPRPDVCGGQAIRPQPGAAARQEGTTTPPPAAALPDGQGDPPAGQPALPVIEYEAKPNADLWAPFVRDLGIDWPAVLGDATGWKFGTVITWALGFALAPVRKANAQRTPFSNAWLAAVHIGLPEPALLELAEHGMRDATSLHDKWRAKRWPLEGGAINPKTGKPDHRIGAVWTPLFRRRVSKTVADWAEAQRSGPP